MTAAKAYDYATRISLALAVAVGLVAWAVSAIILSFEGPEYLSASQEPLLALAALISGSSVLLVCRYVLARHLGSPFWFWRGVAIPIAGGVIAGLALFSFLLWFRSRDADSLHSLVPPAFPYGSLASYNFLVHELDVKKLWFAIVAIPSLNFMYLIYSLMFSGGGRSLKRRAPKTINIESASSSRLLGGAIVGCIPAALVVWFLHYMFSNYSHVRMDASFPFLGLPFAMIGMVSLLPSQIRNRRLALTTAGKLTAVVCNVALAITIIFVIGLAILNYAWINVLVNPPSD